MEKIDVRYFAILFGSKSADMNLSISKRTQDGRNGAYTYGDFENAIILNAKVLQNSYNPLTIIQKLQILIFFITFVLETKTHKSPKYVRNSQLLMNNEKT